jgi:hypothetical protein
MTLATNSNKKTKLRGLSPQANYTDRATAAIGEVVPTFADREVLRGQPNEKLRVSGPTLCLTQPSWDVIWYSAGWSPIGSTRHCGH